MRSIKTLYIAICMLFFLSFSTFAQSDRYQMYVVHEDHIKEGMMEKHHEADKNMVKAAREHNTNMEWLTFVADDGRVLYLSDIDNMAELDINPFEEFEEKMSEDEYQQMFDAFDGTYTKHGNYILRLDKELSYMPEGITQTPEGEMYRELTYYHIPPGKNEKAEELAKAVKKLYTEKNSKIRYRLYKSGFGNMGDFYMVAVAAKSPEDIKMKREENMKLLGDEGKALFDEIENNLSDKKIVTGYVRPDLSHLKN